MALVGFLSEEDWNQVAISTAALMGGEVHTLDNVHSLPYWIPDDTGLVGATFYASKGAAAHAFLARFNMIVYRNGKLVKL